MVLQMLEAGGMPMTGDWPAFEDPRAGVEHFEPDWLAQQHGRAVKILDPHRDSITLPRGPTYRAIWLNRNPAQQSKSLSKFLRTIAGIPAKPADFYDYPKLQREAADAIAKLRGAGATVLPLRFESILEDPETNATVLATFCGIPMDRMGAMAKAVRPRPTGCAPRLDLELQLLAERKQP